MSIVPRGFCARTLRATFLTVGVLAAALLATSSSANDSDDCGTCSVFWPNPNWRLIQHCSNLNQPCNNNQNGKDCKCRHVKGISAVPWTECRCLPSGVRRGDDCDAAGKWKVIDLNKSKSPAPGDWLSLELTPASGNFVEIYDPATLSDDFEVIESVFIDDPSFLSGNIKLQSNKHTPDGILVQLTGVDISIGSYPLFGAATSPGRISLDPDGPSVWGYYDEALQEIDFLGQPVECVLVNDLVPGGIALDYNPNSIVMVEPGQWEFVFSSRTPIDMSITADPVGPNQYVLTASTGTLDPATTVYFIAGYGGGVIPIPGCNGLVAHLEAPVLLGAALIDEEGYAVIEAQSPYDPADGDVFVQVIALDGCLASHLTPLN